jgi:hypothetical protein
MRSRGKTLTEKLSTRVLPSNQELWNDPLKILEAANSTQEALYIFSLDPRAFWAYFLDIELEPFQLEFVLAAEHHHRLMGEWPAGFGKSTNMSYGYIVWHICRNPNVRIISVMKTAEESNAYGLLIRNTLEKNEKLIATYGDFRDSTSSGRRTQSWSQDGMNVAQRTIFDPHYTVEWYGSNSDAVLGHRCDIIVIDDVVTPDTAGTPERRAKQLYRMREQYQTAPQYRWRVEQHPNSYPVHDPISHKLRGYLKIPEEHPWPTGVEYEKIVVVGTVFHYQDLYHTLEADKSFHFIRHDCFITDADGKRESLWPDRWTAEKLDQERESLGTLSFNRRYRNMCVSEDDLAFRRADIEGCKDPLRSTGEIPKNDDASWRLVLSLDPASGNASRFSAYPSFVLVAYDNNDTDRKRYLIDLYRRHSMGYHDMLSKAIEFHDRYDYDVFVVEKNAFGSWLFDEKAPQVHELQSRGVRFVEHTTGGNKKDPEWGVRSIEPFFRKGLYSVPAKTQLDNDFFAEWVDEFIMYPQGYGDYCMSTWFADLVIRQGTRGAGPPVKPGGGKIYTKIVIGAPRKEYSR